MVAMIPRTLTPFDRLLVDAQNALGTLAGKPVARRPNPAGTTPDVELDPAERRHAAGLRPAKAGAGCRSGAELRQAPEASTIPPLLFHLHNARQSSAGVFLPESARPNNIELLHEYV